jgi:hypothetical protein
MITLSDVLSIPAFNAVRKARETETIAAKSARRLTVAGQVTLLFENKVTLLWQVQEMCRVEGITAPLAIQHEIDTYGAMLPRPNELSATMLLEYTDPAERDRRLSELLGLHRHVWFDLGGVRADAVFDSAQFDERRLSSVQFLRVPLSEAARAALFDFSRPAALVIDHPALQVRTPIAPGLRGALVEDLSAE